MWRAFNDDGTLTYSFVDSVVASGPGYFVRFVGGSLFLTGMLIMLYNVYRTARIGTPADNGRAVPQPVAA
jgi:cytochrome c oxidase cbb3-type subunit 1